MKISVCLLFILSLSFTACEIPEGLEEHLFDELGLDSHEKRPEVVYENDNSPEELKAQTDTKRGISPEANQVQGKKSRPKPVQVIHTTIQQVIHTNIRINVILKPVSTAQIQSTSSIRSTKDLSAYLEKGGDPNARHSEGWPLLLGAVKAGRPDVVDALIEAGADVKAKHLKGGATALHYLAWSDSIESKTQMEISESLINAGADVNARNNKGQTPLMLASARGNYVFVYYLLDSTKVTPGLVDSSSRSAEWYAEQNGHKDIVSLLNEPRVNQN